MFNTSFFSILSGILLFSSLSFGQSVDAFLNKWEQTGEEQLSTNSRVLNELASQLYKNGMAKKGELILNQGQQLSFRSQEEELDIVILAYRPLKGTQKFAIQSKSRNDESSRPNISLMEVESKRVSNGQHGIEIRLINGKNQIISGGAYAEQGAQRKIYVGNLPFANNSNQKRIYVGNLPRYQSLANCVEDIWPELPRFVQRMCNASFNSCMNQNNLIGCTGVIGCAFGYLAVCLHQNSRD
ncbi:MAG: hypothetical protein AAF587_04735 [Bacteroidota bacterium]